MSASKRFNTTKFEQRWRELERLIKLDNIFLVEDLDTTSLITEQVLYVDNVSKQISSSNNFFYNGNSVGIKTNPDSNYVFDVNGNTRITGEVIIDGSLVVIGSLNTINTIEFDVSTNYININQGQQGIPPSTLKSGIRINRGDLPDYLFEFSEEHKLFKVGISGNTINPVTERELTFKHRTIPIWDGSSDFQGKLVYDECFVLDNSGHLGIGVNDFTNINNANLFIEDNEPLLVIYSNTEKDVGIELIRGPDRLFGQDEFTDWRIRSSGGRLFIQSGFGGDPTKNIAQFTGFDLGRFGIGSIVPTHTLDVNGISNFRDSIRLNDNLINDVSGINFSDGTYIGEGNSFDISTNKIVNINGKANINMPFNFWQKDSGFIGISSNSTSQNLGQLEHSGGLNTSITAGGYKYFNNSSDSGWQNYGYATGAARISLNPSDSEITFHIENDKPTSNDTTIDTKMTLENTGNLTITGTYSPFTGSHKVNTFSDELVNEINNFEGLLVNVKRSSKITILNSQIFVELTTTEYSKNVYGIVYLINSKNDIFVNSIGEGSIWVSNKNGNIESGDFVVSSTLSGYSQAQGDTFFANYTVAKIMINCDFTQPQQAQLEYNKDTNEWEEVKNEFGETVMENEYDIRYLNDQGVIISQTEYDTILSNGGNAYIAAFLPCIYYCG